MSDHKTDSGPIPFDDTRPMGDAQMMAEINERFDRGRARMRGLEAAVAELRGDMATNTAMTAANGAMTRELHEAWMTVKTGISAIAKAGRGLMLAGRWVRKLVVFATPLVAAAAAAWHFLLRDGKP